MNVKTNSIEGNSFNGNVAYLYIDESQDGNQKEVNSSLYLCASLILCEYSQVMNNELENIKISLKNDQFIGLNKKSISKLLHYNDDNDEVKTKVTDSIRMMYFKSYVSKKEFKNYAYNEVYYSLLRSILKNRIIKYKDRTLIIRYEQNSKITKKGLEHVVSEILNSIAKGNKHLIKSPPVVEEVTKEDVLVSIPDYTLGLYLSYLKEKNKEVPRKFILYRFEKIRSKLRLFIDIDDSNYLSRKEHRYI